jgi:transposase
MSRRSDLHPIIKRLHEEDGLTFKEIGAQLGIHLKTACDYYSDPTGEKYQERQQRWRPKDWVPCPRCGGKMSGATARRNGEACRECYLTIARRGRDERVEDVAAMYREGLPIKEIARQLGYGLNSTPPELTEARRRGLIGYRYSEQRVQNIRKGRWAA